MPHQGVTVQAGPLLDGLDGALGTAVSPHDDVAGADTATLAAALAEARPDVVICLLPTGSTEAVQAYARASAEVGAGYVNATPSRSPTPRAGRPVRRARCRAPRRRPAQPPRRHHPAHRADRAVPEPRRGGEGQLPAQRRREHRLPQPLRPGPLPVQAAVQAQGARQRRDRLPRGGRRAERLRQAPRRPQGVLPAHRGREHHRRPGLHGDPPGGRGQPQRRRRARQRRTGGALRGPAGHGRRDRPGLRLPLQEPLAGAKESEALHDFQAFVRKAGSTTPGRRLTGVSEGAMWSAAHDPVVTQVLTGSYGLGTCRTWSLDRESVNSVWRVETSRERYALKRLGRDVTPEWLAFEDAALPRLTAAGIPVAARCRRWRARPSPEPTDPCGRYGPGGRARLRRRTARGRRAGRAFLSALHQRPSRGCRPAGTTAPRGTWSSGSPPTAPSGPRWTRWTRSPLRTSRPTYGAGRGRRTRRSWAGPTANSPDTGTSRGAHPRGGGGLQPDVRPGRGAGLRPGLGRAATAVPGLRRGTGGAVPARRPAAASRSYPTGRGRCSPQRRRTSRSRRPNAPP
ncbi:hypothetical protein NKH77_43675 [Streptomyces sp. M19]